MRIQILISCLLVGGACGCWKRTPETTTQKPTTTTTKAYKKEVEETVQASNYQGSNAARTLTPSAVDNTELRNFSEELFALDKNAVRSKITINYQGKTTSRDTNDAASAPLFSGFQTSSLSEETYTRFLSLLDNYIANVKSDEDETKEERKEKNLFLDALSRTDVIKATHKFLRNKGFFSGSLRDELDLIWFTPYSRSRGTVGSSGFEHVFLGELKNGEVTGFHNWIFFLQEEQKKNLDYKGYMKTVPFGNKGEILKMRFDWLNKRKNIGSMFIGTSPELEIALYTICFYARPGKGCNLKMNNQKFRIKIYTQQYQGHTLVGSAYPEIF